MEHSIFKKGSRKYQMAYPSPRALKRRANMPGVKALSGFILAAFIAETNQVKTVNDSNTTP